MTHCFSHIGSVARAACPPVSWNPRFSQPLTGGQAASATPNGGQAASATPNGGQAASATRRLDYVQLEFAVTANAPRLLAATLLLALFASTVRSQTPPEPIAPAPSWQTLPAPNSSLWQRAPGPAGQTRPLTLGATQPFYREELPPREIGMRSIVTIRVIERSEVLSDGEIENRKTASYDAVLQDWIRLVGLKKVIPDPQSAGDPQISGSLKHNYRAESELEAGNSMSFTIAAQVVDIRPNGNLVLEARRMIRNNEESWEIALTGICRREDLLGNNEVLSTDVADLQILKRERGQVRDAYRRGWFTRAFDLLNPF